MTTYVLGAVAAVSVLFGLRCYLELRRWVRLARGARILIADKRRVVLDAPVVDWIEWARMLGRDEAANGRVVYRGARTSVAVANPAPRPKVQAQ